MRAQVSLAETTACRCHESISLLPQRWRCGSRRDLVSSEPSVCLLAFARLGARSESSTFWSISNSQHFHHSGSKNLMIAICCSPARRKKLKIHARGPFLAMISGFGGLYIQVVILIFELYGQVLATAIYWHQLRTARLSHLCSFQRPRRALLPTRDSFPTHFTAELFARYSLEL